jgi:plasmid stabilization system protein ParE
MKVIWSEEALISYEKIVIFILEHWNVGIALEFEKITNQTIDRIKSNHLLCPSIIGRSVRKCIIHKNVSLLYSIKDDILTIVAFVDNRSNQSVKKLQ